jgi:hypothetical protein
VNVRIAVRIAWSLWAVTLALAAGAHVLALASRAPLYGYWIELTLIAPTFATLGALIVSRRPGNVIGWLFLVLPIAGGMQFLSGQYATAALSGSTRLPAGAYAAWLSTVMQGSAVFTIIFLIMLFPTGRLLSPRWRVLPWTTGLVIAVALVSLALTPGPIQDFASFKNPFGVEAAARGLIPQPIGDLVGLACVLAAIFSLVLRFYRSRGEERLQLKWFAYAATLGVMAILFGDLLASAFGGWLGHLVWIIAPLGLPVSAAIAILRYRLYDIDVLINRTLVYGAVTATLAAVYAASVVLLLHGLFRTLTGDDSQARRSRFDVGDSRPVQPA